MKRQTGNQTVEFTLIAFPFVLLMLALFELTRFLWVSMIFESAVNHAMRVARTMEPSYSADRAIETKIASFPNMHLDQISLSIPRYALNVTDLVNYRTVSASDAKLGQYTVSYDFSFLLMPYLTEAWKESLTLQRVMVVAYDS